MGALLTYGWMIVETHRVSGSKSHKEIQSKVRRQYGIYIPIGSISSARRFVQENPDIYHGYLDKVKSGEAKKGEEERYIFKPLPSLGSFDITPDHEANLFLGLKCDIRNQATRARISSRNMTYNSDHVMSKYPTLARALNKMSACCSVTQSSAEEALQEGARLGIW